MTKKILLIDDDPTILEITQLGLQKMGYDVSTAQDGEEGLDLLDQYNPHLVILDIMMPEVDGWEVCRRIREASKIPIIMLTALGAKGNVVKGLNLGADDYLVKPFNLPELHARIDALLRRMELPVVGHQNEKIAFGQELVIDLTDRQIHAQGQLVHLSPLEYDLLVFLVKRAGQVVATDKIFDRVWPYDTDAGPENVKWYIWRLRKKIEKDPNKPRFIITEHGFGYRFSKF